MIYILLTLESLLIACVLLSNNIIAGSKQDNKQDHKEDILLEKTRLEMLEQKNNTSIQAYRGLLFGI